MRTKDKGRHDIVCRLNCVIHVLLGAPQERLEDEILVIYRALYKSTYLFKECNVGPVKSKMAEIRHDVMS